VICVLCFDGVCVVGGPTFCPLLGDVSVVPVCVLCCGCGKKKNNKVRSQPKAILWRDYFPEAAG
jgi:hypothetical protein